MVVFTVVVTRTKLIDLSPCQTDGPISVRTSGNNFIEPYRALTEPHGPLYSRKRALISFLFKPFLFDGDCVWETWTGREQIPEEGRLEYIFARSKYLQLEIVLVIQLI